MPEQRFGPENTSFTSWLLSHGYVPILDEEGGYTDKWRQPGRRGKEGSLYKKIFNKEGCAWQADVMAHQLMQQHGIEADPNNPLGLPYSPGLFSPEAKLAALQAKINEIESQRGLEERYRAIGTLRDSLSDPVFTTMVENVLRRFENPEGFDQSYYDRIHSQAQETNARALQDNLEMIRTGASSRGVNSGVGGMERLAVGDASRRVLENRREVDTRREQDRIGGLNTAFNQGTQAFSFIDSIRKQISDLYGSTEYLPTELSGLASSLDTNLRGYRSGRGFGEL